MRLSVVTFIACLTFLAGLLAPAHDARAVTFEITNITATSTFNFSSGLSLNNTGVVGTITEIGGLDEYVLVDKDGNVTDLTQGQFTHVGQGSINDVEQAAFLGNASSRSGEGDVIFFDGTNFNNLTSGNPVAQPAGVLGRTLNNSGQIAFGSTMGLFFFDGTQVLDLTFGTGISVGGNTPPALNDSGQIAFHGTSGGRRDAFLFNGTDFVNLSDDPSLGITGLADTPSINSAGEVVFLGTTNLVPGFNLYHFDGIITTNLSQALDLPALGVSNLTRARINDLGHISFTDEASNLWFLQNGQVDFVTSGAGIGGLSMNDNDEMVVFDQSPGPGNIILASPVPGLCGRMISEFDSVITGTQNNDILLGTAGSDLISGLGGDDLILGGGGDDCLRGGPGQDVIFGHYGDDEVHGGEGRDTIRGGSGADRLFGENGRDNIGGGVGNNEIFGGPDDDILIGGPDDDVIKGQLGSMDFCFGFGGSDTIDSCELP